MTGAAAPVLSDADPRCLAAAAALWGRAPVALTRDELRPAHGFGGRLWDLLAAAAGSTVCLVVPAVGVAARTAGGAPGGGAPAGPPPGALVPVLDHVNLELRSPLTGPWPPGEPRRFPCVTGVYAPVTAPARGGPPLYSAGATVAGVADMGRLSAFERAVACAQRLPLASDRLVAAAVFAALLGARLAAAVLVVPARGQAPPGGHAAPDHDHDERTQT